ncbi:MAG: FHA domain-containing protein [Acidobacteriota bacterium]
MKPEPEEVGMESLVVNMDFNPRSAMSQAAGLSPEEVDDLAELDELSKSLDDLTEEPAVGERGNVLGLKPIPMPAPVADEMSESSVADRMPSSSPPLLTDAAFEDSTFVKTSGSSGRIPPPPPPRAAPPEPPRADGAMPHLVLKGEAGTRRAKYPLKKGVSTVGRGLDNEVVLDDRAVSRKHATIGYELDGSFRITDLGSENGTYVNGTRITSQILREGDEIHLGKTTLIFTIPH